MENTTQEMLEIATHRLNWYIFFTILSIFVSAVAVGVAIYFNRKQLKANHDWNRRSFTTSFMKDIVNELSSTRKKLDELTCPSEKKVIKDASGEFINFSTWREANTKLMPNVLHEWVCNNKEQDESEYKRVAKADKTPCITTREKEEIVINILHIVNLYEQIGSALKNNVLDEEIILDLMKNPIKSNYELFADYIKHRQDVHGDINLGKSFLWAYEKLNYEEKGAKRKGTEEV
ncbi:MAG: hypothetical protein PHE67_13175 [Campylobacterales bacterium]|nr:hypothetical protein [Campylobacterales bacterium]